MADIDRSDVDRVRDGAADGGRDVALGFGIAVFMIVSALIVTLIAALT